MRIQIHRPPNSTQLWSTTKCKSCSQQCARTSPQPTSGYFRRKARRVQRRGRGLVTAKAISCREARWAGWCRKKSAISSMYVSSYLWFTKYGGNTRECLRRDSCTVWAFPRTILWFPTPTRRETKALLLLAARRKLRNVAQTSPLCRSLFPFPTKT